MNRLRFAALVLLVVFAGTALLRANEFDDLKATVQQRAEKVAKLKNDGVLREGTDGMLQAGNHSLAPEESQVMEAENSDRERLFQIIADGTETTADKVAGDFAKMAMAQQPAPKPAPTVPAQPTPTPVTVQPTPTPAPTSNEQEPPAPLRNERTDALDMKVITRPFSNIYLSPAADAQKLRDNVPAFTTLYVYKHQGDWYQVGSDPKGKDLGWMKADDVIEWKHNLVVEFTHPDERQPVLLFNDDKSLAELTALPKSARTPKAQALYDTIKGGKLPAGFPVSSMEPRREVNSNELYLLPIIDFKEDEIDGREGRLLKLAAATSRRGTSPLRESTKVIDPTRARNVQVDLVFVMDLTKSMQPFASRTVQMINSIAQQTSNDPKVVDAFRFGIWGYRDDPVVCGPGMEWTTHNFTPQLQNLSDFALTLTEVHETKTDSIDYEEDVLSGMAAAIEHTEWRKGAEHFIILVGDAPGRELGKTDPKDNHPNPPKGNARNIRTKEVRELADAKQVYVSALYLKSSPKWAMYEPIGADQFSKLSLNLNDPRHRGNYRLLNGRDANTYGATAQGLADGILEGVRAAQQGLPSTLAEAPPTESPSQMPPPNVETEQEGKVAGGEMAKNMFRGALVDFLAKEDAPKPPNDITLWASDRDFFDPVIQSLRVEVSLTANELNSLKVSMDRLVDAGIQQRMTGEDFFKALQAVVATTVSDPGKIGQRGADVAPKFLQGLPYRSRLMSLTSDSWMRMGADAQDQFLRDLESKLQTYQSLYDERRNNSNKWHKLNENDDEGNAVVNVPLEDLP